MITCVADSSQILLSAQVAGHMVVRELLAGGLPWPVILIVLLLKWTANVSHEPIGYCELFAGQAEQSKAFER